MSLITMSCINCLRRIKLDDDESPGTEARKGATASLDENDPIWVTPSISHVF